MIDLTLQFKLIIFSFIFGFMFSASLEGFNKIIKKYSTAIEIILSFIFILFMTFVYFVGIQKIGNAIFHIYSILSIIVGFILYDILIKIIANNNKKWYTLYGDNMPKRRISKASKRRLTFFGTISLIAIAYFFFSLLYNIYTIYDLTMEKKSLENLYVELQEETETLKIDIQKLNDKDYLANYAREHYSYTNAENGEYIIKIDDIEEIEEDLTDEINKNYMILGLSGLMLLIFIYILSKGKKKRK